MKFRKQCPELVQLSKEIKVYGRKSLHRGLAGGGEGVYAREPNNKKAFVNEV